MSAGVQPAGPPHDQFVQWCRSQDVEIHGIEPARIPQRGLGMVATEPIKAGTKLVLVPPPALLTTDCIPDSFIKKHPSDITVHGLLASFLTNGSSGANELGRLVTWRATWPTHEDFAFSMPLLWPSELRSPWMDACKDTAFWPMPCNVSGQQGHWDYTSKPARKVNAESLIHKQQRKLDADLAAAQRAFPEVNKPAFVQSWLVVNTRSFFYDLPLRRAPRVHEDKMILCPFIDYFNHADAGCHVEYSDNGYVVTADRDYSVGEELFVSYGAHDSDLLWVEYGFIPRVNRFDCLCLDPWMLAPSTGIEKRHSHRLKKAGYLGKYHIVAVEGDGEVCFRTEVAVRAATMRPARWLQFVKGKDIGDEGKAEAHRFLHENMLLPFREVAVESIQGLQSASKRQWASVRRQLEGSQDKAGVDHIRESLILRWEQILTLVDQAIGNLDT